MAYAFFMGLHFVGGILVPFFTLWGKVTFMQIMILQAWFMLCHSLWEIPAGTIADKFGRKHSLILASIVNVGAVFIYTSMPNFFIFMIGEAMWALAQALVSGADEALIYDTLKELKETEKSKKIFGRIESFYLLGIMVSAPIGSVVAFYFGLRTPVLMMGIPFFIAFLIAFSFKEPELKEERKPEKKSYIKILRNGLKQVKENKIIKILAFDMIMIAALSFMMIWLYQPMLTAYGMDIAFFGIFHAIFIAAQMAVMNNYERLEKLFRSKRGLIFASSVLTGIGFLMSGLIIFLPLAIIGMVITLGFGMTRAPLIMNYINKHIPSNERATILSTITSFQTLAFVGMYLINGILAEWSLNYTMIILGILCIVFAFLSRVEEKHLID